MTKKLLVALSLVGIVLLAFNSAENKKSSFEPLLKIQLGMSADALDFLGPAISSSSRERVYWLENGASLLVTLFEDRIIGAWLKFNSPLDIKENWAKHLKFVQVSVDQESDPTWFFAGDPFLGKVFKINKAGLIESITWVKPFESQQQTKNLQALYKDFTTQNSVSL